MDIKKITLSLIALLIIGCDKEPIDKRILVSSEKQVYMVTKVEEPPHFYVNFKNIETGKEFNNIYIKKECDDWQKMNIGSKWTLYENTYHDNIRDNTITVLEGMHEQICLQNNK